MDWEDVKTFREVMEAGTVRAAAKRLGVHHSTVSRRIEQLEKSLDSRLFERRLEGYFPTASGEELARVADQFSKEYSPWSVISPDATTNCREVSR